MRRWTSPHIDLNVMAWPGPATYSWAAVGCCWLVARRVRGNHEGPGQALTAELSCRVTPKYLHLGQLSPPLPLSTASPAWWGCQDELFAKVVVFVVTLSSHKAQLDSYNYQQPKWFTCSLLLIVNPANNQMKMSFLSGLFGWTSTKTELGAGVLKHSLGET